MQTATRIAAVSLALFASLAAFAWGGSGSGTWTAELSRDSAAGRPEVELALHPGGDSHSIWSRNQPISELPGFSAKDGDCQFSLVREAGTFSFDGSFRGGSGAGHYTFAESKTYDAEMSALGFSDKADQAKTFLAYLNIGPRLAKEYRALGFDKIDWGDLNDFAIHGVTPAQVTELRGLGLSMREPQSLINFRIHGVSPEFIRGLRENGLAASDEEKLIELRIHGVTPEFIRDIRKAGLAAKSEEKLIELRIHGVTPEFVEQMHALGVSMTDDQAIALRIHGVSPEYVKHLRENGFSKAGPDDFVRLRISGVDEQFARGHDKSDE